MSLFACFRAAPSSRVASLVCWSAIVLGTVVQTGCLGVAANLMHAVGADMIPPEYEGLEEAKVAVVTVTEGSQYSNDAASRELNRRLASILTKKVDKISLVREDEIQNWRDVHGYDATDFAEIGEGVDAQKVVGIEVADLELRDGPTLFRGSCNVVLSVVDVATGTVEYTRHLDEFTFPTIAGQYTSETTETRFRKLYLEMLAKELARSFHAYDLTDRLAQDSAIAR